jgi:WD40 repeat protein
VGGWGGQVKVWGVATGGLLFTLDADSYAVGALAWNQDGTLLASNGSAYGEQMIRIWNMITGELIGEFQGGLMTGDAYHSNALAWSPDGSRLSSTSDDGKIYIWDAENYEVIALYEGYSSIGSSD